MKDGSLDDHMKAKGFSLTHHSPAVSRNYVNESHVYCDVSLMDWTFEFTYVTRRMHKFSSGKCSGMTTVPGHFDKILSRFMEECKFLIYSDNGGLI